MALGTDAQTSGDRVAAESYFQHAEHYFRIIAANTVPPKEKQVPESADNAATSEGESPAQAPRKSRNRKNDEQATDGDGQEGNPAVVDLGTAEQPVIELASEKDSQKSSEDSDDADDDAKPKRKVSRTRTLRRRTSSRNTEEKDSEEINTTD
jgi:hypothetical protein